jgi:hypothetical protein
MTTERKRPSEGDGRLGFYCLGSGKSVADYTSSNTRPTLTLQKKGGCIMVSDKNPTSGNGDKWAPSRINAPFEILQIQALSSTDLNPTSAIRGLKSCNLLIY